jgi:hypothetical protein
MTAMRWVGGLLVLVLAAGLSSCGIPTDGEPRTIVPPAPYQDLASTPPPVPTPSVTPSGTQMEILFLTRASSLVEVTRTVNERPSIATLIAHLTEGPTTAEQEEGLGSTLTAPAVLNGYTIDGGLVTVALGDGLDGLSPTANLLAIAQLVCTLDAHPDVTGVVFTRAGERRPVPRGDGSSTEDPVTAADYQSLIEDR